MKRRIAISISLVILISWLGTAMDSPAYAADAEIVVKKGERAFTPADITIKQGDKITWRNKSEEEHFLTSAGPASRKEIIKGADNLEIHRLLKPGESYTHELKELDIYYYFCAIHLDMQGTVKVEP